MKSLICEICNSNFEPLKTKRTCSKSCSYKLRVSERRKVFEGLSKTCNICDCKFFDKTKRKLSTACKSCQRKRGVTTRRSRGSYVLTDEQKDIRRRSMKKKYANGWNPNTPEHKEKLSCEMKKRWASGEMLKKTIETSQQKYGTNHWTQSQTGKKRVSSFSRNRKHTDAAKANMRLGAANRIRNGNHTKSFGCGGYREDIGHYVRSKWEANFARILIFENQRYDYEKHSFVLSDKSTYTPDFVVGKTCYEIKGRWLGNAAIKCELFRIEYENFELKIIGPSEYKALKGKYKQLINWE